MTGYTVLDFQTTGLEPGYHHRVVEIGVVLVDDEGSIGTSWSTLINPQRDVGETALHGITARDVLTAPTFDDLVPHVLAAVTDRTLVAHNPTFDLLFLDAELRRAGVPMGATPVVGLSTRDWFHLAHAGRARRRLVDCCELAGIELAQRFSSKHQSMAVAHLLQRYIHSTAGSPPWEDTSAWMRTYPWPRLDEPVGDLHLCARAASTSTQPSSWLDQIAAQMPIAGLPLHDAYLDVLEHALLDRYLSLHEAEALIRVADDLGLDRGDLDEIHRNYLTTMARVALQDAVLSEEERSDMDRVATWLGLDAGDVTMALLAAQLDPAPVESAQFVLLPGDAICITGSTRTPRGELEHRASLVGLSCGGLTRTTKLLVAADPDSLSGKAKKARGYCVPIVTEDAFMAMIGPLRAAGLDGPC